MKHENNIQFLSSKSIEDNIFFYRMDCMGGVPWLVYLYDKHGINGIKSYNKDILPTLNHCLHIHNGIYPAQDSAVVETFCKNYIKTLTDKQHKGPFLAEQIISIFGIIANKTV